MRKIFLVQVPTNHTLSSLPKMQCSDEYRYMTPLKVGHDISAMANSESCWESPHSPPCCIINDFSNGFNIELMKINFKLNYWTTMKNASDKLNLNFCDNYIKHNVNSYRCSLVHGGGIADIWGQQSSQVIYSAPFHDAPTECHVLTEWDCLWFGLSHCVYFPFAEPGLYKPAIFF